MAFFGNFISIPIVNLLTLLTQRSGVLTAEDYFRGYRLSMDERGLLALELDGQPKDVRAAELLLLNLIDAGDSNFQFRTLAELDDLETTRFRAQAAESTRRVSLQVLAMGLAKVQDDLLHRAEALPSADAVLVLHREPPAPLEGSLGAFWEAAQQILEWGVSPREVSVYTDYPLRSVLLCSLELLGRGLIVEKPRADSSEQIQHLGDLVSFDGIDLLDEALE